MKKLLKYFVANFDRSVITIMAQHARKLVIACVAAEGGNFEPCAQFSSIAFSSKAFSSNPIRLGLDKIFGRKDVGRKGIGRKVGLPITSK